MKSKITLVKFLRDDLLLIVGTDALSLFDHFGLDEMHGLNRIDCINKIRIGGKYISGLCNLLPGSEKALERHFIFINESALGDCSIKNCLLIFHEATHYAFEKFWDTLQENEECLISLAEEVATDIARIIL